MSRDTVIADASGRIAHALLEEWRASERRYAAADPDAKPQAAREVAAAWTAYQQHVAHDLTEVIVVADDQRILVAAGDRIADLLGFAPSDIIGLRVDDIAAPGIVERTPARWDEFRHAGRDANVFALRHRDGTVVRVQYQAESNVPVPGLHVSRLRVLRPTRDAGDADV